MPCTHTRPGDGERAITASEDAARPRRVAIIDADSAIVDLLNPTLRAAGFELIVAALHDFPDSRIAVATLQAGGVVLIDYDLYSPLTREDPPRLREEFISAAMEAGIPLLISNISRWLQEEQAPSPPGAQGALGSPTVERLLSAITRELSRRAEGR